MAKREFTGGLNELLGGNNIRTEEQPSSTDTTQELQPEEVIEEATPEEEEDLINSIEDEELKEALRRKRLQGNGRPRKGVKKQKASEGYVRACMIVNEEKYNKLKTISLKETLSIKEVMEAVMDMAIEAYEKRNGAISSENPRGDASKLFK